MKIARVIIVLFWAGMMGWLVRCEAYPHLFAGFTPGYRALFKGNPLVFDTWFRIEFRGASIGYSHTWVDTDVKSFNAAYTLRNQTALNLRIMGQIHAVNVRVEAVLDENCEICEFYAVMSSGNYATRVEGRKTGAQTFSVRIGTPGAQREVTVNVPEDAILYSPMTEMALAGLNPGETTNLRCFDPLTLTVLNVRVEALRKEGLKYAGREEKTTVLKVSCQGMDTLSWIDSSGRILRQETPLGWTMTLLPAREAMSTRQAALDSEDLLAAMAVSCAGSLKDPRGSRRIKIRINGTGLDAWDFSSPRQSVETRSDSSVLMVSRSQAAPGNARLLGAVPEELMEFLVSSPALQADHPEMKRRAKLIVGNETDSWAAASAIAKWVHDKV